MAERIKERRIAMGLTQEELGEKLGLQKSAIAKYENGRVENIKRSIISNMAKILNCSPCYLMGWSTDINIVETSKNITNSAVVQGNNTTTLIVKNDHTNQREISDQAVELLRIFESLNVKGQTELLSFAFKLEEKLNENKAL